MKNTLTINANNSCACECLDCLNDGTNSIWLAVEVGNVTNPKITIDGVATDLNANTTNIIEISKSKYIANAVIAFNYSDDGHTGDTFTITFPNKLDGNLMIKQIDNFRYNAKYTVITGGGGQPYELPIASKDILGGIKVGRNLSIEEDGTLNAEGGGGTQITVDDHLSETSENPVQNKVIAIKLNEVFQSVSDGKEKVAAAITDKGQPTAANDTFQTMADHVLKIMSAGDANYMPYMLSSGDPVYGACTYSNIENPGKDAMPNMDDKSTEDNYAFLTGYHDWTDENGNSHREYHLRLTILEIANYLGLTCAGNILYSGNNPNNGMYWEIDSKNEDTIRAYAYIDGSICTQYKIFEANCNNGIGIVLYKYGGAFGVGDANNPRIQAAVTNYVKPIQDKQDKIGTAYIFGKTYNDIPINTLLDTGELERINSSMSQPRWRSDSLISMAPIIGTPSGSIFPNVYAANCFKNIGNPQIISTDDGDFISDTSNRTMPFILRL